jgi:uncharacterized membrane protein
MKVVLTSLLALIAYVGSTISCIWSLVEFILYLVKDKPFNWWSVWSILIFIGLGLIMLIHLFTKSIKNRNKSVEDFNLKRKSKFQERLDEMEKKRRSRLN